MKYIELSQLTPEALNQKLIAEEQTLSKLHFAHAINPLEKPTHLSKTRKHIARIKTLQNAQRHTTQQPTQ